MFLFVGETKFRNGIQQYVARGNGETTGRNGALLIWSPMQSVDQVVFHSRVQMPPSQPQSQFAPLPLSTTERCIRICTK